MSEKHTVAMFVQGEDGRRVQVGWASPKDGSGVRTFEYSPGYEDSRPKNVSFEDDELSQQVAEEQFRAQDPDGTDGEEFEIEVISDETVVVEPETPLPAEPVLEVVNTEDATEPVEDAFDAEQAAEPVDAYTDETVELSSGGEIVEVAEEEDEEAEFQRLLAEEEAAAKAREEQPTTRRELRENEN